MSKSILLGHDIPLESIVEEKVYLLLDFSPTYEYDSENNKRTDKLNGYAYVLVNTNSFDKFTVKIKEKKPLMNHDALIEKREKGEKVFVELTDATVRAYWSSVNKEYLDSFKASGLSLVDNAVDLF